jgi:anti-anti-sigma factor
MDVGVDPASASDSLEGDGQQQHARPGVFECDAWTSGDLTVVTLCGELDIATADTVTHAVADAPRTQCRRLIIDLRALEFIDSCGLRAILRARTQTADRVRLELIGGPPPVARVFELTGVSAALTFRDTLPDAVAEPPKPREE